jgi:hypothetical protein
MDSTRALTRAVPADRKLEAATAAPLDENAPVVPASRPHHSVYSERSEPIQNRRSEGWTASLRSQ